MRVFIAFVMLVVMSTALLPIGAAAQRSMIAELTVSVSDVTVPFDAVALRQAIASLAGDNSSTAPFEIATPVTSDFIATVTVSREGASIIVSVF